MDEREDEETRERKREKKTKVERARGHSARMGRRRSEFISRLIEGKERKESQHAHDTQSFRHHRSRFVLAGWDVRHFEHDVIYWDIVLITTLDLMQKNAYDALIEQRASINRIPLGVDYLVITDPGKIG